MAVLAMTQDELRETERRRSAAEEAGEEWAGELVDCITHAQESLKTRLELVQSAFARLCVVNDEIEEDDKHKGDADVREA